MLLPTGQDASPWQGYPPKVCCWYPFIHLGEERQSGGKVARYSFSGSIPPKFEHKLRCHKQSFGKIATTVVLDKNENLL